MVGDHVFRVAGREQYLVPVPLPRSFVVKNGSKMCALTSSLIPVPVSLTGSGPVPGPGGER